MTTDPLRTGEHALSIVGEVARIAGDNPDVREAGKLTGKSILTISKTVNNALLPLAAVNFAFERAREYFTTRFTKDLEEKAAAIPADQVIEPKASVAGPALQSLAFCHDEAELRDLFLGLLATAMDRRKASIAHPAFVDLIKQLDAEDATLLQGALRLSGLGIIEIRLTTGDGSGWTVVDKHILDFKNLSTGDQIEVPRHRAVIDNWTRLGLVSVSYETQLAAANAYAWADTRPECLKAYKELETDTKKVTVVHGVLSRTAFGLQFAQAVGILDANQE